MKNNIREIIHQFAIYGDFIEATPFGSGHINSTFRSVWNQAGVTVRYIHQRINEQVFTRPDEVMDNIVRVTNHIREGLIREGHDDTSRRTLTVIPARDGKPWARDRDGG